MPEINFQENKKKIIGSGVGLLVVVIAVVVAVVVVVTGGDDPPAFTFDQSQQNIFEFFARCSAIAETSVADEPNVTGIKACFGTEGMTCLFDTAADGGFERGGLGVFGSSCPIGFEGDCVCGQGEVFLATDFDISSCSNDELNPDPSCDSASIPEVDFTNETEKFFDEDALLEYEDLVKTCQRSEAQSFFTSCLNGQFMFNCFGAPIHFTIDCADPANSTSACENTGDRINLIDEDLCV